MARIIDTVYIKILPELTRLKPDIEKGVKDAVGEVEKAASKSVRNVDTVAKQTQASVTGHVHQMATKVTADLTSIGSGVKTAVQAPLNYVRKSAIDAVKAVDTASGGVVSSVGGRMRTLLGNVSRFGGGVVSSVAVVGRQTVSSVASSFRTIGGLATTAASHIGTAVSSTFSAVAGAAMVGVKALGAATIGLGLMGGAAVITGLKTAASMEQAQISFETLLGSAKAAKTFLADLAKFAAATPYTLPGLIDASRQLIGAGLNAKQTKTALLAYGNATSALGLNEDQFNHIMLATSQALAAGTLHAGDLLQMTEAGLPVWKLLSEALHKPVAEVKNLSEQGKLMTADVLPKLEAQMQHDYGGAMVKQSQTLAGLWSTMTDTFQQGMAKALLPLEPVLRKILPRASEIMGEALGKLGQAFATAITWVTEHWPQIKTVFSQVWGYIKPVLAAFWTAIIWLRDHVLAPVVAWIVANWPTITAVFKTVRDAIVIAVGAVVTGLVWFKDHVLVPVVAWIVAHWPEIQKAFKKAWEIIKPLLEAMWKLLQALWEKILKPIVEWVVAHWPEISKVFQIVATIVGVTLFVLIKWLTLVATVLTWLVNNVVGPLMKVFLFIITIVIKAVIAIWNGLVTAFHAVADALVTAWNWLWHQASIIWSAITGAISLAWNTMIGAIKAAWNGLVGFLTTAWATLKTVASTAWNAITGAISDAWNAVVGVVEGVWSRVSDAFSTGVNWVIDHIINPFIHLINTALGWLGVHIGDVGNVGGGGGPPGGGGTPGPAAATGRGGFATGGVVPGYAPGRDVYPAMLSPGEGILVPEAVRGLGGPRAIFGLNSLYSSRTGSAGGGYQFGGLFNPVGGALHAIGSVVRTGIDMVRNVTADVALAGLHAAEAPIRAVLHLGPPFARQIADGLFKFINDKIEAFIRGHAAKEAPPGTIPGGGTVSADVAAEQRFAASLFPAFGWAASELSSLISLWNGESGWNPRALNPSSGAYGIPQSLPASKMASAGADWQTNPATQIRWGEAYIHDVYGTPSAAWSAWLSRSPHWYADGMPPTVFRRPTLIGVGERGAETVSVTRGARGGPQVVELGPNSLRVLAEQIVEMDGAKVAKIISRHQEHTANRGGRR